MTAPTQLRLVCGCIPGVPHWETCALGEAEQVAVNAATTVPAPNGPRSPLIAALVALERAGLLTDPDPDEVGDDVVALLDLLWEMDRIPERSTMVGAS